MTDMDLEVLAPRQEHETGWRLLWDQYCDGAIAAHISDATWQRLLDPASAIGGLIALSGSEVVGFAHYVVHEGTWEVKPICYVEDVFVSKLHRGRGSVVARAMAQTLFQRAHAGEWSRIWGVTAADNVVAQRLYAGFSAGQPYMRYVLRGDQ